MFDAQITVALFAAFLLGMVPSHRYEMKAAFFGDTYGAYVCSTEACGAVENGVEDGLQVERRARNGAQHFRDGRLVLDEFGHPILRLRSGPFSADTLVHVKQFAAAF
jgi:hypothetical protein